MPNESLSRSKTNPVLTQHAMLVAWGLYGQSLGIVKELEGIKLNQRKREHSPQTKILEFFVAILAGYPHLKDISRSSHPLDQDQIVAEAWGQPSWADYSGVSRTLHSLTEKESKEIADTFDSVSTPFIKREIELALQKSGYLIYDGDLTGRPVSSTSTSYPDTAFGYMGDTIELGYQSVLVSLHSPSYGRLWLSNQLHPGDTVSMTQVRSLVESAEERTGVYPRRRSGLLSNRIEQLEAEYIRLEEKAAQSEESLILAESKLSDTQQMLNECKRQVFGFEAEYAQLERQPTSSCKLTRTRKRMSTYEKRLPKNQKTVATAKQRFMNASRRCAEAAETLKSLQIHYTQLEDDNAKNPHPVCIILRLDGGFASRDNLDWLIEMGYDIYTKSRSTTVRNRLTDSVNEDTNWQRVGKNASLVAWSTTTVDGYFSYPLDVALTAYKLGHNCRHSVLLHYGERMVTQALEPWFHFYNGRQTIEAGIKEGKGIFQMHHLKVRSPYALRLQEHLASFAANFVRFAAAWFVHHQSVYPTIDMTSVKQMVQVGAHTSAWVHRNNDIWLLMFTQHSYYAGQSLYFGKGAIQLPLPFFSNFYF